VSPSLSEKYLKAKGLEAWLWSSLCLPSKCKTLSSNSSTAKNKKEKERASEREKKLGYIY
jgi:hypothetical protein